MRISDWSSDVCSSDLKVSEVVALWKEQLQASNNERVAAALADPAEYPNLFPGNTVHWVSYRQSATHIFCFVVCLFVCGWQTLNGRSAWRSCSSRIATHVFLLLSIWQQNLNWIWRSEEHTSELQSLMRNSYAV